MKLLVQFCGFERLIQLAVTWIYVEYLDLGGNNGLKTVSINEVTYSSNKEKNFLEG